MSDDLDAPDWLAPRQGRPQGPPPELPPGLPPGSWPRRPPGPGPGPGGAAGGTARRAPDGRERPDAPGPRPSGRGAPQPRRRGAAPTGRDGRPATAQPRQRGDGAPAASTGTATRAERRQAEAGRKRSRRRRRRVLIVLLVLALPFVLAGGWFAYQILGQTDPGKEVTVQVKDGWGATDVGDALASKGVISSALAFQIYATVTGAGPFDSGPYTLHEDEGIRGAISILEDGPPRQADHDVKLLLPPGLTTDQIAARVAELPGHTKEAFLAATKSNEVRSKYQPPEVTSLDGFLFPDTYFVAAGESDLSIIQKLVTRFDEIADRVGLGNATRVSPYQTIVVGSLVEKEAKLADDQAPISAVIYNRLRDNMMLQIDATLCFVKGGCPPPPTDADKAVDSPYNTYKVTGLPPTPIASVTEASLKAALSPADVPYLFYVVADENGKHAFATTLAEHNRNVEAARAKGLL